MLEKLEEIKRRYEDVEAKLADPKVIADMKLFKNTFANINKTIRDNPADNCIFVNMFFPDIKEGGFRGGHTLIVSNMNTLESGLSSYNRFFNKQY